MADSAFASVKSAVALKQRGLFFMGLVKTAHRKFPKQWAQTVTIDSRGGHKVAQATESGVELRAVSWNDGKKDKKKLERSFASVSYHRVGQRYRLQRTENADGVWSMVSTRPIRSQFHGRRSWLSTSTAPLK